MKNNGSKGRRAYKNQQKYNDLGDFIANISFYKISTKFSNDKAEQKTNNHNLLTLFFLINTSFIKSQMSEAKDIDKRYASKNFKPYILTKMPTNAKANITI